MQLATPDQFRLFRHRRTCALLIDLAMIVVAPVAAVVVFVAMGEPSVSSRVASALVFLAVAFGGQVMHWTYFRCPACGQPLGSGPTHVPFGQVRVTTCGHCRTLFEG